MVNIGKEWLSRFHSLSLHLLPYDFPAVFWSKKVLKTLKIAFLTPFD